MSLKKKIILSFSLSAVIIAVLVSVEYINFIKIRKEITYLEITDTIRSKSLQLRRHEKNFFLHGDLNEVKSVYDYLTDLKAILRKNRSFDNTGKLINLQNKIEEYQQRFNHIEIIFWKVRNEFNKIKPSHTKYSSFFPLIESTLLERPLVNAELLGKVFALAPESPAIMSLLELDSEINTLRKNGEDIINISKDLDRTARENADSFIQISQLAILVFFPLFFIVGIGVFLFIISNVVRRLQWLMDTVEKTGMGIFSTLPIPSRQQDEVTKLTILFNDMAVNLRDRETMLIEKEKELYQSKKLAALGTLASGVAHELNNPLNNIYTTAQRLIKKTGEDCPSFMRKGLDDIFGQAMRVKRIVGDLLEFARGREPLRKIVELNSLITGVYKRLGNSVSAGHIKFILDSDPDGIMIHADPEQMEQVFINLFTNAVEVMPEKGELSVKVDDEQDSVKIIVSDTGMGIPREFTDKIFEPFFTSKEKGTGLGLAIVFNIIKKHNGEISFKSEKGKGTTFIIRLPKNSTA
ncbi:MAG: ATP-binding protein [Nitrospirota bacterium]